MKRRFFKAISLFCCIAMCAGVLFSCKTNTHLPEDTSSTTEDPTTAPADEKCYLGALDQKATDDEKMIVTYDIPKELTNAYDSFEVRVYHNDTNNNLLCATAVDATAKTAYVTTSYGKIRLELVGLKAANSSATVLANTSASVWADEYNFASLNATFPVVYFTLELFSMEGESRDNFEEANAGGKNIQFIKNVPTFVSLERTAAYNWNKLPDKVHTLPNTTSEIALSGNFHAANEIMAAYIKELAEVNPNSKFNFYCVDNYPELIVKFFTAQGIKEENFNATMISDGTASVSAFKSLYAGADSYATYETMKAAWETIKQKAAAGDSTYLENLPNAEAEASILWKYAITIANEEDNVQWWCSRDNFTKNTESQAMKDLLAAMNGSKIQYFGINDMLANLSEEDQVHLKELFHFDGEMFAPSTEANKKSLVIMGTSPASEGNLEAYMKLLQAKYGNEYVIYYKGHPGYPTGLDTAKLAMFEANGIIDLESSIAAELILFYCPDIYLAGFPSTTFKSAAENSFLAMFDKNKTDGMAQAITDGYSDIPDTFYTVITAGDVSYVKIENAQDDTVQYFNATTGDFLDALPA